MKIRFLFFIAVSFCSNAHAAVLSFDFGNSANGIACSEGSCFGQAELSTYVNISSYDGLIVDGVTTQSATGSHSGAPDGSESPGIDNPWEWLGNTGMFFTSKPVMKVGGANNTVLLDLSGLNITWNGDVIPRVEEEFGLPVNPAVLTCTFTCADGESYLLSYEMVLPGECHPVYGDPSCFGAVYRYYDLRLSGIITGNDISNVPLPAAFWLLISGMISMAGFSGLRSRK